MAYNFKNLNEVDRQDKPTENTTVMAFEAGQPKQIPASEFGGKGLVVDLRGYAISDAGTLTIDDMNYDLHNLKEGIPSTQYKQMAKGINYDESGLGYSLEQQQLEEAIKRSLQQK